MKTIHVAVAAVVAAVVAAAAAEAVGAAEEMEELWGLKEAGAAGSIRRAECTNSRLGSTWRSIRWVSAIAINLTLIRFLSWLQYQINVYFYHFYSI